MIKKQERKKDKVWIIKCTINMDAEGAPIMRHLIAFDTLISDQQTECF